jgi:hypothetical protein
MPVKDAGELYGVPLDQFVLERDALVKALRSSGDREEAARAAKLPKPSVAAWTVNQLVRTQGRAVGELFDAGDAVMAAQSDLLAGRGDADALRDAGRREREARIRLTEIARGLLSSEGHEPTAATLERVSETLHAAALDAGARSELRDGCLLKELRHAGIGGDGLAVVVEGKARGSVSRSDSTEERRAAVERARELKLAQRAVADTGRLEQRAARELEAARERRQRAQASLREAEGEVVAAQARAEEAALARRRARDALDRL